MAADEQDTPHYALMSRVADLPVSGRLLVELLRNGTLLVDPSWLLDSIEAEAIKDEKPYLDLQPEAAHSLPHDSGSSTKPSGVAGDSDTALPSEEGKESAEFFLQAILDGYKLGWDAIYDWCCRKVCEPHSVASDIHFQRIDSVFPPA